MSAGIEKMARIAGSASEHTTRTAELSERQTAMAEATASEAAGPKEAAEVLEQTVGRFMI